MELSPCSEAGINMDVTFIFVLIFVMIVIFIFFFLYQMASPMMVIAVNNMEVSINETSSNSTEYSSAINSLNNVRNVWKYWIIVLVFFMVLWIIIATQKTEPMYAYGG